MTLEKNRTSGQTRMPNKHIRLILVVLLSVGIALGAAATATGQTDAVDRTVEKEVLPPGASTTVTVNVNLTESQDFNIVDKFDAFSKAEVIDADSAFISEIPESNDEAFASYLNRDSATFVYQVTVPETAEDGDEFTISSSSESDVNAGTDTVTVREVSVSAERKISNETLEAGESATVSVNITADNPTAIRLNESVDDRLDVTIIDDGGAENISTMDSLNARWNDTDKVRLVYEVRAPDNAGDETYSFSGVVDTDTGAKDTLRGDDQITVPADVNLGVERTVEASKLSPGESTTVTINAGFNNPEAPSIAEVFDPAFADFEVIDDGDAQFVLEGPDGTELTFAFGTVEITESTMQYEVTIPEDAEPGQEFTIASASASDYDLGTDVIEVTAVSASAERSIGDEEILVDGTTEVTVTTETSERTNFQVTESIDRVSNISLVGAKTDGDSINVDTTNETVIANVSNATTATVTYEITVGDNVDQPAVIGGSVVVDNIEFVTTGNTEVTVVESPLVPYADDDGVIRLSGVLNAISDYTAGEIELEVMLESIGAYGSGSPVS